MKAIDWILIGYLLYFLIGFICGIISVRAYKKEYGDSPVSIIMFVCNLAAWWIAFPDQMIDLRQDRRRKQNELHYGVKEKPGDGSIQ